MVPFSSCTPWHRVKGFGTGSVVFHYNTQNSALEQNIQSLVRLRVCCGLTTSNNVFLLEAERFISVTHFEGRAWFVPESKISRIRVPLGFFLSTRMRVRYSLHLSFIRYIIKKKLNTPSPTIPNVVLYWQVRARSSSLCAGLLHYSVSNTPTLDYSLCWLDGTRKWKGPSTEVCERIQVLSRFWVKMKPVFMLSPVWPGTTYHEKDFKYNVG